MPPEILDYVLENGKVPQDYGMGQQTVFAEVDTSTKKDMIIISLTEYSILLNEVISVCISEIDIKDSYVQRLKEELK